MTTAPVLILIAKRGCPACEAFAPDAEGKQQQGYAPGQASEWEKLINDPAVGQRFWSREFRTGTYADGRRTVPDQFAYVQFVPKVLVASGPAYTAAFDLQTGTVKSNQPVETKQYNGEMRADAIKKWLLEIYPSYY